jgi:RNA polymerase sigma-70 factor (ECF subfamily)
MQDEKELVARVIQGDPRAEEAFFRMYQPRLLRAAAYFLGHQDSEAEDIVQETFMVALPKLSLYVFDAPMFAWLRQICLRLCYARLRARNRVVLSQEEDLEVMLRRKALERLQGDEQERQNQADLAELRHLVQSLGSDSRQIIEMRTFQGLRYVEISAHLGIPMGTVMSRLARARTQLRSLLEEGRAQSQPPLDQDHG